MKSRLVDDQAAFFLPRWVAATIAMAVATTSKTGSTTGSGHAHTLHHWALADGCRKQTTKRPAPSICARNDTALDLAFKDMLD